MKSIIARQSAPGNIGSWWFEIPPCLTRHRPAKMILLLASATTINSHRIASVPQQHDRTTVPYVPPLFATVEDLRINPHSVELGRRFSPIPF